MCRCCQPFTQPGHAPAVSRGSAFPGALNSETMIWRRRRATSLPRRRLRCCWYDHYNVIFVVGRLVETCTSTSSADRHCSVSSPTCCLQSTAPDVYQLLDTSWVNRAAVDFFVDVVAAESRTPACTLALPWPLWYLGACRMLSYPPHSAHHQQQQVTAPMSLAFPGQTQHHQQQQQSRVEQSTDKTPAVGDEDLQKPPKVGHGFSSYPQ